MLELKFGQEHSLMFFESGTGPSSGLLHLVKDEGEQSIPFYGVNEATTEKMFNDAWASQGNDWDQLTLHQNEEGLYEAKRALWLPFGQVLMWSLTHFDKMPFDTCGILRMRKEDWRFKRPAKK